MFSICLIALSLAVDATAAAICCGVANPGLRFRDALRLGGWFGGFQGGMTALGGLAGSELNQHFTRLGAVAAFGLLLYLGGRMVLSALSPTEDSPTSYSLETKSIALLAVATSLDALAVGVSVAFLDVGLWTAAAVIGGTAFVLSAAGSLLGCSVGKCFHQWASVLGGLVLMGIGVKIILQVLCLQ